MERDLGLLRYRVRELLRLIRYRFFLWAGIIPYLLGQVIAWHVHKTINWHYFCWGFLGIALVLAAVELLNEYFDRKSGGERIFSEENPNIPGYFLPLALCFLLLAFFISLYFTFKIGRLILLFSFLGFLATYFYVGPPIKWAYRGLGELVIALSYGPLMVLGSYYLQTERIDLLPIFVSLILGLLIFVLALANELPDYYQDRLVGKRNIVVRLGRENAVRLFSLTLLSVFILIGLGIILKIIPPLSLFTFFLLPLIYENIKTAQRYYDYPLEFISVIKNTLLLYLIFVLFLGISYLG
ncbi:MAG: prenyltransferase, partial [Candidatus Omnitrophica bacterium]|nr:prenyltransferase [Candidatus Omnitrophota bacterium]